VPKDRRRRDASRRGRRRGAAVLAPRRRARGARSDVEVSSAGPPKAQEVGRWTGSTISASVAPVAESMRTTRQPFQSAIQRWPSESRVMPSG
jgi:hypothetical protein